ncbi:hypothetical protein ACFE04_028472 [Oxalis oulophora]
MDDVSPSTSTTTSTTPQWQNRELAFRPYSNTSPQALLVAVRKPNLANSQHSILQLVARLTKGIIETYQTCNPQFKYSEELNPKRYLTTPSIGVLNDGHDNVNSDLILAVNTLVVNSEAHRRYVVKDVLGHGTFGQVAKCWVAETNSFVAVKIIKNQPAYYQQALVELNKKYDPDDKHHIVRIYDYFVHHRHLCICFELLDTNLYELIKMNQFRGLSLSIVQLFSKQILRGLALLKDAGIIHCDLKPENILLCTSAKPGEFKIIDFGSACMQDRTVYSYIQSRYYRSPEVLLGYQYTTAIDMWSFGCIVAELFLGLPLFPGASEFDLLRRMIEILGSHPPDYVLKEAKNTSKFFKCVGSIHNFENSEVSVGGRSAYQALTVEEYEARELKKPAVGKEYFKRQNLVEIVTTYPYKKNLPKEDQIKESQIRLALIDFLRGLVEFDPAKRWSPFQASKHPFVTGEPFTCPYVPPPETHCMPVAQNCKVDHHPGGGHWFGAGLSPNMPGMNRASIQNSPHFQMIPNMHANSYGSVGSHGSYTDNPALGSSYGSYGDNNNMLAYYSPVGPSAWNNFHGRSNMSMLGSSPDARRRVMPYHPGNGLGMSPSAGNFAPLPLGTSPSQFTPPSPYNQGSAGSSGHFGPPSPRNSAHGSPLGKMNAGSHLNRRKSWGYSGSPQSQESSSSHWQAQYTEAEGISQQVYGASSSLRSNSSSANWKQQQGVTGVTGGFSGMQNMSGPSTISNAQIHQATGTSRENQEASSSIPDPGDWDPNYSDELLLEEDNNNVGSLTSDISKHMHISSGEHTVGSGRYSNASSTSSKFSFQRQHGSFQQYSHMEESSPPYHDPQSGFGRPISKPSSHFTPHFGQNPPSRLGQQQPVHRFNNPVRPAATWSGELNHLKVQTPPSGFNFGGQRSPGSGSISNGLPWGRRGNHSVTNMPPASRGRKDHGRAG